jgi:cytidine deaminase
MMTHQGATTLDATIFNKLLDEAKAAALCAYAPYSNFRVGAAVLGQSGAIYRGANVENASLGLGTCAERVALASAIADGERNLVAIAVACVDAPEGSPLAQRVPCGACRQWIQELAPDAEILILGESRSLRISDLLPMAFSLGREGG